MPLPGTARICSAAGAARPRFSAALRMARASGCSERRSSAAARARTSSFGRAGDCANRDDLGLAFGERAGFVEDHRVDASQALEAFAAFEEDAELRAAPDGDGKRGGNGESHGAGAGDDQHGDGDGKGAAGAAAGEQSR